MAVRRVVAAISAAMMVAAGLLLVPPASAATTHNVSLTCTNGGFQVAEAVDAKAGDTLVVSYSGCGFFDLINGLATVSGGDGVPTSPSGYTLKGTGTVTLSMVATGTFGQTIVYFSPTTASSADQTYIVYGATDTNPPSTHNITITCPNVGPMLEPTASFKEGDVVTVTPLGCGSVTVQGLEPLGVESPELYSQRVVKITPGEPLRFRVTKTPTTGSALARFFVSDGLYNFSLLRQAGRPSTVPWEGSKMFFAYPTAPPRILDTPRVGLSPRCDIGTWPKTKDYRPLHGSAQWYALKRGAAPVFLGMYGCPSNRKVPAAARGKQIVVCQTMYGGRNPTYGYTITVYGGSVCSKPKTVR